MNIDIKNMNQESLRIILKTYSKGGFNEDEAVQLIEELYKSNISYVPYYPYWPQVTYDTQQFPKYEITCKKE